MEQVPDGGGRASRLDAALRGSCAGGVDPSLRLVWPPLQCHGLDDWYLLARGRHGARHGDDLPRLRCMQPREPGQTR